MNVQIIVDSTADLPQHIQGHCRVVPVTVHFGDEELLDGVNISKEQFYERLTTSDVLPTTSQATPATFAKVFDEVARAGDSAVVLTLSSGLSGTYQSACIAAADYENIHVVDSKNAAIGIGILAEYAFSCARQGMDAQTIAAQLEQKREDVCVIALVDTLEYLKRGGRVSKTAAFAGSLLNIKPLIAVIDGEVQVIGKARGAKQGGAMLTGHIAECGGIDYSLPLLLGYSGLSDERVRSYVADTPQLWQPCSRTPEITLICSVIGTHTGPGVVATAFFRKH